VHGIASLTFAAHSAYMAAAAATPDFLADALTPWDAGPVIRGARSTAASTPGFLQSADRGRLSDGNRPLLLLPHVGCYSSELGSSALELSRLARRAFAHAPVSKSLLDGIGRVPTLHSITGATLSDFDDLSSAC